MKRKIFILSMFLLSAGISCEKIRPDKSVVINELMPSNSTIPDQNGEFDDWIELYNLKSGTIDLSGYYLSDNKANPRKWQMPSGTYIVPNGYLIIWADNDTLQTGLHANFKLSASGESVVLSDPGNSIIDEVDFPAPTQELTYSRRPNGTGKFTWQAPSPNTTNDNP